MKRNLGEVHFFAVAPLNKKGPVLMDPNSTGKLQLDFPPTIKRPNKMPVQDILHVASADLVPERLTKVAPEAQKAPAQVLFAVAHHDELHLSQFYITPQIDMEHKNDAWAQMRNPLMEEFSRGCLGSDAECRLWKINSNSSPLRTSPELRSVRQGWAICLNHLL